jgi:hypothetical protein
MPSGSLEDAARASTTILAAGGETRGASWLAIFSK